VTDVTDAHRAAFDAAAEDWFYPNLRDAIIAAVLGVDAPVIVNAQERPWPEAAVAEVERLRAEVQKWMDSRNQMAEEARRQREISERLALKVMDLTAQVEKVRELSATFCRRKTANVAECGLLILRALDGE